MNCAVSPRRFLARLTPSNVSEAKLVRDSANMPRFSFDLEVQLRVHVDERKHNDANVMSLAESWLQADVWSIRRRALWPAARRPEVRRE